MVFRFGRKSNSEGPSELSSQKDPWPKLNELLWIRLPCCENDVHPTRVEDLVNDNLVISTPSKPHLDLVPTPSKDKSFLIGWRDPNGSKQVNVQLVDSSNGNIPTWTLKAVSKPVVVQRRRYVRANWDRDLSFYLPGVEGARHGGILDFSEGGMRAWMPMLTRPDSNSFEVFFTMDGEPIVIAVEMVWWTPRPDRILVGLEFSPPDTALSDRLRKFTFDLQLSERRREGNEYS